MIIAITVDLNTSWISAVKCIKSTISKKKIALQMVTESCQMPFDDGNSYC